MGTLRLLEAIRFLGLEKKLNSIKPRHQSHMVRYKKFGKKKLRHFTRDHLMLNGLWFTPLILWDVCLQWNFI
jgi:hypothetical protein